MYKRKRDDMAADMRARMLSAARLSMAVPSLATLRIDVHEQSATACITYKKLVVVASAPALFVLACGDKRCTHGGHDITNAVMQALRARETSGEGAHECAGETGTAACSRSIRFHFVAEYHSAN